MSLGTDLRDEGASRALENAGGEWQQRAMALTLRWLRLMGQDGDLFEGARIYAHAQGLPLPPSPNAWGAVALHLSRAKAIERTGEFRKSADARSHARRQPLWRVTTTGLYMEMLQ